MRVSGIAAACAAGMMLAACAARQDSPQAGSTPVTLQAAPEVAAALPTRSGGGYLSAAAADLFAVLPPAPRDGDARDAADRRIYRETRALQDTPRWQMAAEDGELGAGAMLHHFSCSLDIELTVEQAPGIVRMLQRATRDAAQSMARAKDHYKRLRPFQVEAAPTCRPGAEVAGSYDYPSGHTTAGWAWAMGLAQIAPNHAGAILARGRAIGDSRVICGLHNASAVESARLLTGAVMSAVVGTDAWQADLANARAELSTLRSAPHRRPDAARCELESTLVGAYW